MQITLNIAECTVVCIGCGVNLTENPKIRRILGADYKEYHEKSHEHVLLPVITF